MLGAARARLVNIDSGSYDKAGVEAVGAALHALLRGARVCVTARRAARDASATPSTSASTTSRTNERPIVLMGHRDTVFPKGEAARRPFRIENGRAYGPAWST